jgi:outer membrane immunogenic protein
VYGVPDNFGGSNGTGFVGGGQVGCDYQADRLVVGAQGQFDFGSLHSANPSPFFPSTFARVETTATATATVRAGVLVTPQVLAYVKGGGAWAQTDTGIYGTVPHLYLAESASPNRLGWTVGGGLEWMFAPNWSVFGEYNYMDFGTRNVNFVTSPQAVGIPDVVRTRLKTQTVLAGINYHFNWGGPVVARY